MNWTSRSLFKFRNPGYISRALARGRTRRSRWNLLLIFLLFIVWPVITYGLFCGMWLVHLIFHPEDVGHMRAILGDESGMDTLLFMVPLPFAALPLAMMAGNVIAWMIPPMRRALEDEALGTGGASFRKAMTDLGRIGAVIVAISLGVSFIGAALLPG